MRKFRRSSRKGRAAVRSSGFNMVALMDIFTILVFFLLVNTIEARDLPTSRQVEIPESRAEQSVRQTLTVSVTRDAILLQDETIYRGDNMVAAPGEALQALRQALAGVEREGEAPEVTILGDRGLPFSLLKDVMAISTEAGFEQVSLAVMQKDQGGSKS